MESMLVMTENRGCTGFRLRRAARALTRLYDAHLKEVGLTLTQYSLLSRLSRAVPPRMHELAEAMGMDRTSLTRTLSPLQGRGLIEVIPGEDRRSKVVRITGEGFALREKAVGYWRVAQAEIERRLGVVEMAELHRILDLAWERLGGDPKE